MQPNNQLHVIDRPAPETIFKNTRRIMNTTSYKQFKVNQRVHLPAIDKMFIPKRYGTIERIEVLANGFQRIFVVFDADTQLGTREVHPANLHIADQGE